MAPGPSTARSRDLGKQLMMLRQSVGFTTMSLAAGIGTGAPTVSKVENGLRKMSDVKLIQYLTLCGLKADEVGPYLDLAHRPEDGYYVSAFNGRMSDELIALVVHETTAKAIQEYECTVIPGLLQAQDYSRALFTDGGIIPKEEIDGGLQVRTDRQSILKRKNSPESRFFISENILRSMVGNPKVMNDQMMHLSFACDWDNCSIRVVPAADYGRSSAPGSFRLMAFAEHGPVATHDLMTSIRGYRAISHGPEPDRPGGPE
ncbi:MAG TPA: helix-turn-helix transcriptional regulator [Pseudonocardiaceae bacterium]|jgi:hypothetical protein|nr:helix-turn-helix transcriptional regulator [Pseudonocardiaceae bacterium]